MPDYKASTDISADPHAVFDYLKDVAHLPQYFDRMTSAEPGDGNEVKVSADVDGRTEEGTAWFEVDDHHETISWGSEGPNDYHGRLNVSEKGTGAVITVTLTTERDGPDVSDEIAQGLENTLSNIKRLTEPQT